MSEQQKTKSFMQELDAWCDLNVFEPLYVVEPEDERRLREVEATIKIAIRAKVLESYRNGQAAGPRQFKQPQTGRRV
jgi:hypothetical protein